VPSKNYLKRKRKRIMERPMTKFLRMKLLKGISIRHTIGIFNVRY